MARTPELVISNVRIFDGTDVLPGTYSVTVSSGSITSISEPFTSSAAATSDTTFIDGTGCSLIPGLIDSHVHAESAEHLDALASHGVTAACDMACFPESKLAYMKACSADDSSSSRPRPHILSAGTPATSPGSMHSRIPGMPREALLTDPADAERFVQDRVAAGSDYVKVITDVPGPSQEILNALVAAAHGVKKRIVAHAVAREPFRMAIEAGADCLTHAPLDASIDTTWADELRERDATVVPTLVMMENLGCGLQHTRAGAAEASIVAVEEGNRGPALGGKAAAGPETVQRKVKFEHALESVQILRRAGVRLLAGTDANPLPMIALKHGESMARELELLVLAGMEPIEALRSATSLPAVYWGLEGRGKVEIGGRADLVIVEGEPWNDIGALRKLRAVYIGGRVVK